MPPATPRLAQLVAARRCVQCRAGLLEHEVTVRCDDCKAKNGKVARARHRLRRKALLAREHYQANRIELGGRRRARQAAKQQRGECRYCLSPATDDSDLCAEHLESERARWRAYHYRKAS